jgi:hypothetical protein
MRQICTWKYSSPSNAFSLISAVTDKTNTSFQVHRMKPVFNMSSGINGFEWKWRKILNGLWITETEH